MVGIQYGAGLSQVMWNPAQKQDMLFLPVNFGVTYTRYGKMFGYMPYFGFQAGLFYGKEGYQFKYDEEDDYTYTLEGAEKAVMEAIDSLHGKMTLIIIAHRLTTIKNCDIVYEVKEGKVKKSNETFN